MPLSLLFRTARWATETIHNLSKLTFLPTMSSDASATRQPVDYFFHIPKTAGTSLTRFLESAYPKGTVFPGHLWRHLIGCRTEDVHGVRLYRGHFYGALQGFVGRPVRAFTFLRDPVERALSHHGHVLRDPTHYLHCRAVEAGSLAKYLADPILRTTVENFQVRALAMELDPVAEAADLNATQLGQGVLEQRMMTAPFDRPLQQLLDTALRRLDDMAFVGVTERYSTSLRGLCRQLDLRPPPQEQRRLNVNPGRLEAARLEPADRRALHRLTEGDQVVYRHAMRLLDQTCPDSKG
ncbi:hypothetical protein [Ideonella sp. BN130291]|uniref:hypothetical protein n=1 Tax=Ideonella sp. BN130291 TaxID=3112940 RepID=UPI002E259550|nr:hypothetical protein [Ideonella sp. BN130291]